MTQARGEYNPITQSAGASYSVNWKDILVWGAVIIGAIVVVYYLIRQTGKDIVSGVKEIVPSIPDINIPDPITPGVKYVTDGANALIFDPVKAAALYAKSTVQTVKAPVSPAEDNSYDPSFDPHNPLTMGNRVYSQYILNKHLGGRAISQTERDWVKKNDPGLGSVIGMY